MVTGLVSARWVLQVFGKSRKPVDTRRGRNTGEGGTAGVWEVEGASQV